MSQQVATAPAEGDLVDVTIRGARVYWTDGDQYQLLTADGISLGSIAGGFDVRLSESTSVSLAPAAQPEQIDEDTDGA